MKRIALLACTLLAISPALAKPVKILPKAQVTNQAEDIYSVINRGLNQTSLGSAELNISPALKLQALAKIGKSVPESSLKSLSTAMLISPSKPLGNKFGLNLIDARSVSSLTDIAEIYDTNSHKGTGIGGKALIWYDTDLGSAALISCKVYSTGNLMVSYGDGNPQGQTLGKLEIKPQDNYATFAIPTSSYAGAKREYVMMSVETSVGGGWYLGKCDLQFLP